MAKQALGKGLGALIGSSYTALPGASAPTSTPAPEPGERVRQMPVGRIVPSPWQPRQRWADEQLIELADSIREQGIMQPLIVREVGDHFELIAGERRWRAAQQVGLAEVPAIVREATDLQVLELALIENLQREDLNPIEEARAYSRLVREFGLRQEDVARKVGKNRATVANAMRLLDLDEEVLGWLNQERLSVGHAKALLAVKDHPDQRALAAQILRDGLSVRATERLVESHLERMRGERPSGSAARRKTALPPALGHLQNQLRRRFATDIHIQHGEKKGRIEIAYYGNDDLGRILDLLGMKEEG